MLVSDFKQAILELEQSIADVEVALNSAEPAGFAAVAPGPFITGHDAISLIVESLYDLYYNDDAVDGRYTTVCLGGVSSSSGLIAAVLALNLAKDNLRAKAKSMIDGLGKASLSKAGSAKATRKILNEIGYSRLSLRKCYRHVPLLEQRPVSIRFSYSSGGKSISKITVSECLQLLDEKGYDSVSSMIERKTLSRLPENLELAQVQPLAGYYKANIVLPGGEKSTRPTFMPFFYPDGDTDVIRQEGLPSMDRKPRKARNDQKIKEDPLAASIRVHEYVA